MSKISNTTAYPTVTPAAGDLLVITDVSDSNATKTATVSSISSAISDAGLQTQEITLTPTQILSLNGGGSIELIAAPGAGKIIVPASIVVFLDYNTTAYNFADSGGPYTESVRLKYENSAAYERFLYIININATDDSFISGGAGTIIQYSNALNQPLVLKTESTVTVTQGDSSLKIKILYRIVDFS